MDKYSEQIIKFKEIHKGERCFIIGTGPSLAKTNMDFLIDEFTFSLNKISLIYNKTIWRPTYFFVVADIWKNDETRFGDDVIFNSDLGICSFVNKKCITEEDYELKDDFLKRENIYYIDCHGTSSQEELSDNHWSYDIADTTTMFGSSILALIQTAVYMGFNEIFLLGCDLGYRNIPEKGKDVNHFCEEYNFTYPNSSMYNIPMVRCHDLAKKKCEEAGVKIYNATVGGFVETYERVDFNSLFQGGHNA